MKSISLSLVLAFATLVAKSQIPRMVVPTANNSNIHNFHISPDGKILGYSDADKIRLIDIQTGRQLLDIMDPREYKYGSFREFAFSNDNLKMAIFKGENELLFWDIKTNKSAKQIKLPLIRNTDYNAKLSFSTDNKIVYVIAKSFLNAYDFTTGDLLFHGDPGVDFLQDKKIVLVPTTSVNRIVDVPSKLGPLKYYYFNVKVYNVNAGADVEWEKRPVALTRGGLSNDGRFAFLNTSAGELFLYTLQTGKRVEIPFFEKNHFESPGSVFFSPGSDKLITVSQKKLVKVWDTKTGGLILKLDDSVYRPKSFSSDMFYKYIQFCDNGNKLVFFTDDSTAVIHDIQTNKAVKRIKITRRNAAAYGFEDRDVVQLNVLPNDKKFITATGEVSFKVWNIDRDEPLIDFNDKTGGITQAHFLNDDKSIAAFCSSDQFKMGIIDIQKSSILEDKENFENAIKTQSSVSRYTDHDLFTFKRNVQDTSQYLDSIFNLLPPVSNTLSYYLYQFQYINLFANKQNNIYDFRLKKKVSVLENCDQNVRFTSSPDNSLIASHDQEKTGIWNLKTGKLLYHLKESSKDYNTISFSHDSKMIYLYGYEKPMRILDAGTGELIKELPKEGTEFEEMIANCNDIKGIFHSYPSKKAVIRNIPGGKLVGSLPGQVTYCKFSKDCSKIMTANTDVSETEMTVWDAASLTKLNSFDLPGSPLDESKDARYIITNEINKLNLYDTKKKKTICSYVLFDGSDLLTMVPSGYYKCATGAVRNIYYVTPELKVITFEQLDVRFNRPDKVLEETGSTDTLLIKSYYRAYEKRIKKLEIDTTTFRNPYSAPDADLVNRDTISAVQSSRELKLHIKASDKNYYLDRFNIWVNETPEYGHLGISIRKERRFSFDTTITIKLSDGKNQIEFSVYNSNGTESYRMPLDVEYRPAIKSPTKIYFVGLGIDHFADSSYNLKYSVKDIRDLTKMLKKKYNDDIVIDTFFNESFTKEVVQAAKKQLLKASINDKVIIAYSGHGLVSKDFDYYLSTSTVNFDSPEKDGLPYEYLETLLDGLYARKKLLLLDACHSGELDKDELIRIEAKADSAKVKTTHKGKPGISHKKDKHLSVESNLELMRSLFVNVGKGTGTTVISASSGIELAEESDSLQNGIFTFCVLEAMKKYPSLSINEFKKIISEEVTALSKGLQRPTYRKENINVDWILW